jgi:hypothetical protein
MIPRHLDKQAEVLHEACRMARASNWTVCNHALLHGPPACGKTTLLEHILDETKIEHVFMHALFLEDIYANHIAVAIDGIESVKMGSPEEQYIIRLFEKPVIVLATVTTSGLAKVKKLKNGLIYDRFAICLFCPRAEVIPH